MRIGIDARLIEETGVGRYIRNLLSSLAVLDTTNEYVIFLRQKSYSSFALPNTRWQKVCADVRWHTISEQFAMPRLFSEARLDIVHVPYHNAPILYGGRMVITIHDLTILHFSTGKATTLPKPFYQLKRFGYWLGLWISLRKAEKVIAVSHTTKQEIIDHFHIPQDKIVVTYEGVSMPKTAAKRLIKEPYILYVGNAYPHKNLEILLEAMKHIQMKLVLVGNDDFFYRRLKKNVGRDEHIVFFGPADDRDLASLYKYASALVLPSFMEGFGLPAMEALSLHCPVVVSDIPVFREILDGYATYFDPYDSESIVRSLQRIQKKDIPHTFFDRYSWRAMAMNTLDIYENRARI